MGHESVGDDDAQVASVQGRREHTRELASAGLRPAVQEDEALAIRAERERVRVPRGGNRALQRAGSRVDQQHGVDAAAGDIERALPYGESVRRNAVHLLRPGLQ